MSFFTNKQFIKVLPWLSPVFLENCYFKPANGCVYNFDNAATWLVYFFSLAEAALKAERRKKKAKPKKKAGDGDGEDGGVVEGVDSRDEGYEGEEEDGGGLDSDRDVDDKMDISKKPDKWEIG